MKREEKSPDVVVTFYADEIDNPANDHSYDEIDLASDSSQQSLISFQQDDSKDPAYGPNGGSCAPTKMSRFVSLIIGGLFLLVGSSMMKTLWSGKQHALDIKNSPDMIQSVVGSRPTSAPTSLVSENMEIVPTVAENSSALATTTTPSTEQIISTKDEETQFLEEDIKYLEYRGGEVKKRIHPVKLVQDFSFYVMGDVPYTSEEEILLKRQLNQISHDVRTGADDAKFIVHVGDLLDDSTTNCARSAYERVSNIMKDHSVLPILPVPGNNDWDECPDPEQAYGYFNKYYIPFEQHWAEKSDIPSMTERQTKRQENFAIFKDGILFIGLHLMPKRRAELDEELGAKRAAVLKDNHEWVTEYVEKYLHKLRAVVAFGHSGDGKDVAFHMINRRLRHYGLSLFLFQGDEHIFKVRSNFGYPEDGEHDWNSCWRITVDQGGIAPPLKVTIRGNYVISEQGLITSNDSQNTLVAENDDQLVFDNILKIDRKGGTYYVENS